VKNDSDISRVRIGTEPLTDFESAQIWKIYIKQYSIGLRRGDRLQSVVAAVCNRHGEASMVKQYRDRVTVR
jgi:hypothetical protein